MKKALILFLAGCSCGHVKGRKVTFIDDSETSAKVWMCISDPDIQSDLLCADMITVMQAREAQKQSTSDL